jgi:hypothetical protein
MKYHLLFFNLLALLLHACSKDNDNKSSVSTGKMTKIVTMDGTNTTTTLYSYDANGKLSGYRQSHTSGGSSSENGVRIVRKAGDMIDKIIFKNGGNTDSTTITTITSGQLYNSMEWAETYLPVTVARKFTFTYDNQGKIAGATKIEIYAGQANPQSRYDYTYLNDNLSSMKLYQISGGTNLFLYDYNMEYDQKVNPIASGNDWILLSLISGNSGAQNCSANNLTKMSFKQTGSPSLEVLSLSYTYNEQNLPVKAAATFGMTGRKPETSTFTYE